MTDDAILTPADDDPEAYWDHVAKRDHTPLENGNGKHAPKTINELAESLREPEPEPELDANGNPKPRVFARSALSYAIERVHWLEGYEGFIPLRMVTLCAGLPGLGKSMLVCYLAAQESKAGRTVCIAAAEDSIEHVLIPRLIAARADLKLIEFIGYEDEHGDGALHLPDHGTLLRATINRVKPSLFAVDPIGSFLGRAVDAWKDTDVRSALGPFKTIAEENQCACLLVAHLNKGSGPYLKRIGNSAAFGQFVRSGLLFGRDPDDKDREKGSQRVLVSGKLNVGAPPQARCYDIESTFIPSADGTPPDISTARLNYKGESPHTTEELLANSEKTTTEPSPETREAVLMLNQILAGGKSIPRKEIESEARSWGLSMKPVYNAAERLDVVFEMAGFQKGTNWRLP